MRTIDEIMADMQAIMSQATLTQEDVNTYLTLEAELAAAQAAQSADDSGDGEGELAPANAPDEAAPAAPAATVNALRTRHNAYTRVVVPAGRPSNRQREDAEADGFRAYLRTGRVNSDMQRGPQNAQTTGTGSSGGYLVPEGFLNRIVEVIKSFGGVLNDAEHLTTDSGNPLPFPTNDDTSNEAVVTAESTTPASGADLVFGTVQLSAFEYTASGTGGNALAVPLALIQDAAFDVEAYVAKKLGQRLARKMAKDAVTGTGTGQAQGILQGITGAEISSALTYDNLVDLIMSLDEVYWANARWYMNRASFGTILKLEDGADQLIFKPAVSLTSGNATQADGAIQVGAVLAPVVLDSAFSDILLTAGAGQNWGIFGDISEGYVWRQVRQIEVLVDPYTAANKRQIQYNAWARADGRQKNTSAYKVIAGYTA
jgi:HK97 family phage major capsid protein